MFIQLSGTRKSRFLTYSAAIMIAACSTALGDEDFYEDVITSQNPLIYWQLGESSGPTATNMGSLGAAGNGSYGAVVNYGQSALATSSNNNSILLSKNVESRVLQPSLQNGGSNFTEISISFWVQGEDNGLSHFFGYAESSDSTNTFLCHNNEGNFRMFIHGQLMDFPGIDVLDGVPHHVGITWRGSTMELMIYVDGQRRAVATLGEFNCIFDGGPLAVGQDFDAFDPPYSFDAAQAFAGTIDEFALFNRVLSPTEVALQANPPSSSAIRIDLDGVDSPPEETQEGFNRLSGRFIVGDSANGDFTPTTVVNGVSVNVNRIVGTSTQFRDRGIADATTPPQPFQNLLRDFLGVDGAGATIEVTLQGLPNANYIVSSFHHDWNVTAAENIFDIFVDDALGTNRIVKDDAIFNDDSGIGEAYEIQSSGSGEIKIRVVEDSATDRVRFNGISLHPLIESLNVTGNDQTDTETQTLDCDSALFYRVVYDGAASCFSLDTLDSPNDIDTEIALFDATGMLIAQNDQSNGTNQSLLEFDGLDAGTYYLAVAGWNTIFADGFFVQQVADNFDPGQVVVTARSGAGAPINDNWNSPSTPIADPDFTVTGTNVKASTQDDEQQLENTGSTVWWFFDADVVGTVTIDTFGSNFNTQLHIYEFAPAFEDLIPIVNNDDSGGLQSQVTFEATAGTCYEVRVGGFRGTGQNGAGAEGEIVINGSFDATPDVLLGDVNLDGVVNLLDVAPFVDRITSGTFQEEADVNDDDVVNLLDVGPFVALLTG